MSKSAPPPPDYAGAAQAQANSSREVTEQQTWANRPTINTPFGQQTWETTPQWDPSTGQYLNTWTQNTNLTPESQAALDSQMRIQQGRSGLAESLLGRAQDEYGDTMDWSQFDQLAGTPQGQQFSQNPDVPNYSPEQIQRNLDTENLQNVDPSQRYNQDAEDAIYNQWSNRMDPQFTRDTDALRTQLYNSGLKEGDQAYDTEMEKLRQSQGDQRTNAQYQATIGAGEEASRMHGMDLGTRGQQFGERQAGGAFSNSAAQQALQQQLGIGGQEFNQNLTNANRSDTQGATQFGQNMQTANYQNQRRQQQISEEMQRRGFSLNEINAILTGQQVGMPNMPSFNTAQRSEGLQSLQAAGMQNQADLDAYSAQQGAQQSALSGLAGGAMMFSDRRLKKNIMEWTYRADIGLQTYFFNYVWEKDTDPWQYGLMADEVEKLYPEAVSEEDGYKVVDYGRIPRWH